MKNQSRLRLLICVFVLFQAACNGGLSEGTTTSSAQNGSASNSGNSGQSSGDGSTQPTQPAPADPSFKLSCLEAQFITELNLYRAQNSLGKLKVSKSAVLAARWHAQNMIDLGYFDHYEPNGRDPFTRMRSFGYPGLAENAAYGSLSKTSFCQWRNSAGHNKNMLGPSYVSTGIGRATNAQYAYWSSNFGGAVSDYIQEPLTNDAPCVLPTSVPSCP